MLRVTLDTTAIGPERRSAIEAACASASCTVEIKHTTVSDRETAGTPYATRGDAAVAETGVWDESIWDEGAVYGGAAVSESAVLGESLVDSFVVAGDDSPLEEILRIITSGSFPAPGARDNLTENQRHQLRDAMALEAHIRNGRDVFVSDDARAFINHGRRAKLEALCSTRIMTTDEVCEWVGRLKGPGAGDERAGTTNA